MTDAEYPACMHAVSAICPWATVLVYNNIEVRMHIDLMIAYIVMRIDYMRIPKSTTYDQTQSSKHLRSESPLVDGGAESISLPRESIHKQTLSLPCIRL